MSSPGRTVLRLGRDWNPRAQRSVLLVRSVATFSAGGPSVDCLCEGWFLVRLRSLCSCQQPATCDGVCEVKSAGLSLMHIHS
ncbi:unnamed protein product [Urochloa humidicola]